MFKKFLLIAVVALGLSAVACNGEKKADESASSSVSSPEVSTPAASSESKPA